MKVIEYGASPSVDIRTRTARIRACALVIRHSISTTHLLSFTHAFTLRSTLYHALY